MWVATTDEEANFIFDLHNAPDPSEAALQYAQWLEGQSKPQEAEFLRMSLLPCENQPRLKVLGNTLDARWVRTVLSGCICGEMSLAFPRDHSRFDCNHCYVDGSAGR